MSVGDVEAGVGVPCGASPVVSVPELVEVPVELIDVGQQQLRVDPNDDGLVELAASIAEHGLLEPVGVAARPGGRYQLLYGSRRLAAVRRLRRATVTAVVRECGDADVRAVALVENIQRVEMTLREECDAVASLTAQGRSPDQIAVISSRSRAWVLRRLTIPNLPDELRDPVLSGELSIGAAEAIAALPDEPSRRYLCSQTLACKLGIDAVKGLVAAYSSAPGVSEAVQVGVDAVAAPLLAPVFLQPCQACGVTRPLAELALVRVCVGGCGHEVAGVGGGNGGSNGGGV